MSQPPGQQLKVVTRRHPSPHTPQPACLHTAQPPSAHIFPSPNLYLCISFPCNTSRNCHSASGHSQTHPLPPKSPQKQRPQPGATAASTAAPAPRSPLRVPPPRGLHRARAVADRVSGPTPRKRKGPGRGRLSAEAAGSGGGVGLNRWPPAWPRSGAPGAADPQRGLSRAVPPRAPAAPQGRARALRGKRAR